MSGLVDRIKATVEPIIRGDLHAPVPVPVSLIAAHVAVAVVEALKADERAVRETLGDTEETERVQCLEPGCTWSYGCGHDSKRRRWVSPWWAAVEEQP
jgi:hypothetical protein